MRNFFNQQISNLYNNYQSLILYFAISFYPIYLFGSGSIQPSHFILFVFSIIVLFKTKIPLDRYFYTFLSFLIYCYFVSIFYLYHDLYIYNDINLYISSSKTPTLKYLRELIFLTYNFILTISLLSFFNYQKKYVVIFYGLATAILIILFSLLYGILNGSLAFRFTGYFNNPNQLGYFCVCVFSLTYLLYRNLYIPYYLMIILLSIIILFSVLTLSKASYISLFFCVIFAVKPYNYKYFRLFEIIVVLLMIFTFLLFFQNISEMFFFDRLINMWTEQDSSLRVRGYLIFFEANSLQALFGMGIKNAISIQQYDIHSTLAMIVSSFGFVGFTIFCSLLLFWVLDINKSYGFRGVICVCVPSLLYGLTHNGLRFSMFWIMFAVSIYFSKELIKKNFKD